MPDIFPISEQIKCIEREIDMRNRVYPRLVIAGKMTQGQADKEINTMKAVYQTLTLINKHRFHINQLFEGDNIHV